MGKLVPKITKSQIATMWKLLDNTDKGSIELQTLHDFLSNRYGKDAKTGRVTSVIERVKSRILERCGQTAGIKGLQRTLMIMDDNGDKRLSKEEVKFGLRDYGIELNLRELDEIFGYFDKDGNGFVDITEFLVGIRGDLNERRKSMVKMAFDILDLDRSGFITVEEIAAKYDVSQDPKVISGEKTQEECLAVFLNQWDRGDKDGIVSLEEFEDYYKEISASIDGDDYFELMMRNAWRIAGGKGAAANTANLRVLVTDKDGNQRVATVEQELGLKQGDREEIRRRLEKQGVEGDISLTYGSDSRDKKGVKPPPARSSSGFNVKQQETRASVNVGPTQRSQYDRNVAAMKLAAAFRGRVGRKKAVMEKRKADAQAKAKADADAEASIPRAKRLIRPVPKARAKRM
jgi:Ca2+-binding EF-hand superfamily protein